MAENILKELGKLLISLLIGIILIYYSYNPYILHLGAEFKSMTKLVTGESVVSAALFLLFYFLLIFAIINVMIILTKITGS
jgi:hypothetical protein